MRFFSTALAFSAVPAAVLAASQTITVGDGGLLAFNPPNITAAIGDQISFEFRAKNHSVTQSTFASPCIPATFNGSLGVNSGFLALSPNQTFTNGTFPTWTITINDTTPLWFHCAQTVPKSHCESGMVVSINATPEKSFDAFKAAALASTPATDGLVTGSSNSTSTDGSATGSSNSTSTDGSATDSSNSTSADSGAAAAADNAPGTSGAASQNKGNGASKVALSRGAAGLLAVVTVGAMLL